MNHDKKFMRDVAYLANLYRWTSDDIKEIKTHLDMHPEEMRRYWSNLAVAHRAGYKQTRENGYIRLAHWCGQQGWPDPFSNDLNLLVAEKPRNMHALTVAEGIAL